MHIKRQLRKEYSPFRSSPSLLSRSAHLPTHLRPPPPMGQSSSTSNRGRNDYYYAQNPNIPPPPRLSYSDPQPSPPPSQPRTPPPPPPPPPPPSSYPFPSNPTQPAPYRSPSPYNFYSPQPVRAFAPMVQGQSGCRYYSPGANPRGGGWWSSFVPPPPGYSGYAPPHHPSPSNWAPAAAPAVYPVPQQPYVEHEETKRVKNDVNVHKETIRLETDEENLDQHLVSFTFDANFDGSITIFYFAKEDIDDGTLTPVHPELCKPVRVPFQVGLDQKFRQPSGSGVDLGFFELNDLSNPSQGDVFPLVICAEASVPPEETGKQLDQIPTRSQFTEAIIDKKGDEPFQVKVIKQILWIDGQRYELRDIFGLENSAETTVTEEDEGKECVICLSEPRDTAVLPCRHMCMCGECARALTFQSNKCPICRQPVEKLIEIKVKTDDS